MSCIKNLKFTPRELSNNVKRESACHKAKVVGWSAFMALVAGSYLATFSDLTMRAQQLQNQALAGMLEFNDFEDFSNEVRQMNYKINRDIYETKDAKDLKYIHSGWMSQVLEDEDGFEDAYGPQGFPSEQNWYRQTERADLSKIVVPTDPTTPQEYVDQSSIAYERWAQMHDSSVVWYDTAACNLSEDLQSQYGYIGRANRIAWGPTAPQFGGTWYVGDKENQAPMLDGKANWQTDIFAYDVAPDQIKVNDDFSMMKRSLDNMIEMADCDIDCQAKGSQLTLVASLNEASLALIVFNALLGIWGGWSAIGRVSQTYCTFLACTFQLAILIVCATMLFTPYAKMCYTSLYPTAGEENGLWTMHDDYMTVVTLWGTQFVWVFVFLFIGLCGAVRSESTEEMSSRK